MKIPSGHDIMELTGLIFVQPRPLIKVVL